MTTLLILGAIGCMSFAAVITALVVVVVLRRVVRRATGRGLGW